MNKWVMKCVYVVPWYYSFLTAGEIFQRRKQQECTIGDPFYVEISLYLVSNVGVRSAWSALFF